MTTDRPARPHEGSSFDDFLREEGVLEECKAEAVRRVRLLREARVEEPARRPGRQG